MNRATNNIWSQDEPTDWSTSSQNHRNNQRNAGNSRASSNLNTNDIAGAAPKVRGMEPPAQYAAGQEKRPFQSFNPITGDDPRKEPGFSKDTAAFYGATPPSSSMAQVMQQNEPPAQHGVMPSRDVAAFYGATPPESAGRQAGNYDQNAAAFYGATPPVGAMRPQQGEQMYSQQPQYGDMDANTAAFYGATPMAAAGNPRQEFYPGEMDANTAAFYGATPPVGATRPRSDQQMSQAAPPQQYGDYDRNAAAFYGATPPVGAPHPRNKQAIYEQEPQYGGNMPAMGEMNADVAAFYGVTPRSSTYEPAQQYQEQSGPNDIVAAAHAFYGEDMDMPQQPPQSSNSTRNARAADNFFG